jgi:hypothetical protein
MKSSEALTQVNTEIAAIERQNTGKELRPWEPDACPAASQYWGLIQQRIALQGPAPARAACCDSLDLDAPERSEAQKRASEAGGRRFAASRAA